MRAGGGGVGGGGLQLLLDHKIFTFHKNKKYLFRVKTQASENNSPFCQLSTAVFNLANKRYCI